MPSGSAKAFTHTYHFHLIMQCCVPCSSLWLGSLRQRVIHVESLSFPSLLRPCSKPKAVSQKKSTYLQRITKNKGHRIISKCWISCHKFITHSLGEKYAYRLTQRRRSRFFFFFNNKFILTFYSLKFLNL